MFCLNLQLLLEASCVTCESREESFREQNVDGSTEDRQYAITVPLLL
jgi:hypothetical protein